MKNRLQKILSARGVASRRAAEGMIEAGRVTVNGELASLGDSADDELDVIALDGKPIPAAMKTVTIMLHKPAGYVTTMSDEQGRRTVKDLCQDVGVRVYPVGRLDLNSSGLLLMTSDGALAEKLTHPSHEIDKRYRVTVRGDVAKALPVLRAPAMLDGYLTKPAQVRLLRENPYGTVLEMVIHEGRNRQIRRICEKAELKVVGLCRIAIGELRLGELPSGKWRHLTEEELAYLHAAGKEEQYGY
ncbi:MAG: rRNA pseudouridine synthase [Clostridia bacterium]|nr:rRNA pseudouridine synthase [Clostridia bacterium]